MSSRQDTADFLVDQMARAGRISAKKMFGEYGVYCDGKIVALICDDQLFVKPTPAGRSFIGVPREAAPYPGAKPHFLIGGDQCEDADWLAELIRMTTRALPVPKPKAKTRPKVAAKRSKKTPRKTAAKRAHAARR